MLFSEFLKFWFHKGAYGIKNLEISEKERVYIKKSILLDNLKDF
jgi:hypothetical protein